MRYVTFNAGYGLLTLPLPVPFPGPGNRPLSPNVDRLLIFGGALNHRDPLSHAVYPTPVAPSPGNRARPPVQDPWTGAPASLRSCAPRLRFQRARWRVNPCPRSNREASVGRFLIRFVPALRSVRVRALQQRPISCDPTNLLRVESVKPEYL